jgi:hypothetical protein
MGRERVGLYYPDGTFRTQEEVGRKILLEELDYPPVRHCTDFPPERDFGRWTEIITRQQKERQELLGIPEFVEIEITTDRPILLALIGDVHAGGEDVDYDRFAKDVDLIKQAKGYVVTVGDLTDSYFFMPGAGQQLMAGDEQVLYAQAALSHLAESGGLIAGWGGDHDMWPKDKMGAHTLYHRFHERYSAHYLEGVSYLTIGLSNEKSTVRWD